LIQQRQSSIVKTNSLFFLCVGVAQASCLWLPLRFILISDLDSATPKFNCRVGIAHRESYLSNL